MVVTSVSIALSKTPAYDVRTQIQDIIVECLFTPQLSLILTVPTLEDGHAELTWVDQRRLVDQHLTVSWSEKETMAADHVRWRNLLPIVPQGTGGSKC